MEPLVSPPSTAQTLLVALAAKLRTRGCGIRAQAWLVPCGLCGSAATVLKAQKAM